MTRRLATIAAVAFSAGFTAAVNADAKADDAPTGAPISVWLSPGIYSRHFDRSKNFREDNVGPGIEVSLAQDHMLMAGSFINSIRARTHYAAYQWRPLHWQIAGAKVSAGVAAGVFDGYPHYHNGGVFAAALPLLAVEGDRLGVNLSIVPTIRDRLAGAFAIQFELRAW